MSELQISDCDSSYQYSGILFLFEKFAIYTQKLKSDKGNKLHYRGHYDISNSEIYCNESTSFELWDDQNHMKFKFDSKNQDVKKMIKILRKYVPESQYSKTPISTKQGGTLWNKTKSFRKKISDASFSLPGSKYSGN